MPKLEIDSTAWDCLQGEVHDLRGLVEAYYLALKNAPKWADKKIKGPVYWSEWAEEQWVRHHQRQIDRLTALREKTGTTLPTARPKRPDAAEGRE